ncbi:MAG: HTH domain-containing protein [Clostridia bacterium]|nr:HTH domain-containing protein [Clostridia bacterium]
MSRYNDFYGCLLTKHQSEMIKLYYDFDISLFEIAEQFGISRQAVRDTIKRAEQLLIGYEEKLRLSQKFEQMSKCVAQIETALDCEDKALCKSQIDMLKQIMEDNDGDI